jgi:radical SAM superfamily enzyme YgiQ (UPF0313 family)
MTETVDFLIFAGVEREVASRYGLQTHASSLPLTRTIGPSKIANKVREAGYTCQIVDFVDCFSIQEMATISDRFVGPKTVIGVSTTFFAPPDKSLLAINIRAAIKYCKAKYKTKVIVGGPTSLRFKEIFIADHFLIGYAENDIVPLLNKLLNNGMHRKKSTFWDIKSCNHRWHETDYITKDESLPLEIGRGCIFHCKFCRFDMLGKKKGTYLRDIELVHDELVHNYNTYGVTHYTIVDDTFNDDQDKLRLWFDMVKSLPFQIKYNSYIRTDLLHRFEDTAYELAETGFMSGSLGVETLHPEAAKAIGKTWSAKHGPTFVPRLHNEIWKNKVITRTNWIIGLPGEDKSSWLRTRDWLYDNNLLSPMFGPLHVIAAELKEKTPNLVLSIFDKEYEQYGYKLKHRIDDYDMFWENPIMNRDQARKIAHELNQFFEPIARIGNFRGIALSALGIPMDYLLNTPRVKYDSFVYEKIKKFTDEYRSKILK